MDKTFIDNNVRQKKVNTDYHNLRHDLRAKRTFFKKYTHAGSLVDTILPACCIYHFTLQNLQSSAQNDYNAEDFCSIIIETHL